MEEEQVQEVANEIRDIINWVKVFEEEYDLPSEVVDQLRSKLEAAAEKLV